MFKYEMHLHSCEVSRCGTSESVEYVKIARDRGFSGMVFTNHFFRGNSAIDKTLPWREFVEPYREAYLRAAELGDKLDIDVLFGIEEGYGNGKECLIYGISPELIASNPDFSKQPIAELSAFVRENGGFIACAHPFRHRGYITAPDEEPDMTLFDAMEVYNRGNSLEDNISAEVFAKKHGFPTISGGDVHDVKDFGHSGICFPCRVKTSEELVKALKQGDFKLIVDEEKGNFGDGFSYVV